MSEGTCFWERDVGQSWRKGSHVRRQLGERLARKEGQCGPRGLPGPCRRAWVGGWVRSLVLPPLFLFRIKRLLLPLADLHLQNGPFPFPRHLHDIPQWRCHSRQNSVLHGDVLRQSGTVAMRRATEVSRVRESSLLVSGGVGDQSGAAQSEESTEEVRTLCFSGLDLC